MAKKENKKNTDKDILKEGSTPKGGAGEKTSPKPQESGKVKGPKGVGSPENKKPPTGTKKVSKKAFSEPDSETSKEAKPKAAKQKKLKAAKPTSEKKLEEKASAAAKPSKPKASKKVISSEKKSAGKKATEKQGKTQSKPSEEKEQPKKMSRRKPVSGISAEEKMKLPNTSASEDFQEAVEAATKTVKEKLKPGDKTSSQLEQFVKDLIPDPDKIKESAASIAATLIENAQKSKDKVEEILPDKEELEAAVKSVQQRVEEFTAAKKEQKSSVDKPVEATLFSEFDAHLFREGKHFHLYKKLGSHLMEYMGTRGVYFAVWAPNAEKISVMADFNGWNKETHPMKARWDHSGIWEVFIPEAKKGSVYKYFIKSNTGYEAEKGDPFAFRWETPPHTASVVWDLENTWEDSFWMKSRKKKVGKPEPMSVYEMHVGSWKRVPEEDNRSLSYLELAEQLPAYIKEMGFTHIEFMPVMEHPFFGSWGYQITGYFAPSSRFGTPQEFMHLIDKLHQAGIGVILDWVPSHFPSDLHGLHYFDGTHLFEHADPKKGFHPDWQSYIFNYGRNEVRSFLISNALFWLDKFHVDGLRVDAVASMLYLDYSRKEGEWDPNEFGGRENLEAISFLKEFNEVVYKEFPDAITIAEESTAWPMVSKPTYIGGLGFGMKWMMGWMHDTLDYFSKDPVHRRHHQNTITFSSNYAFSENFMLPLSHDEVVYGKGSMLEKMPGDIWNKFANLRTLYAYMYAHPGTKLLFMGSEFGQHSEWDHDSSLDWHYTQDEPHRQLQETLKELNKIYREEPALYEKAYSSEGFEWVDIKDEENSIISFLRKGLDAKDDILIVCNFTPMPRENYRLGIPEKGSWKEIFNSDSKKFGGSGVENKDKIETEEIAAHSQQNSVSVTVPPMGVIYLKRTK